MSRSTRIKNSADAEIPRRACECGEVMLVDLSEEQSNPPPSDVHETPEGVVIRMELPGVPRENIDVRVRGSRVDIFGEKPPDKAGEDASFLCLERRFGKFHRAFDVTGSVNLSRMKAVLKDGVLVLAMPKVPDRRGREMRIRILSEESE